MSRTMDVIRNKNKVEKARRKRQINEIHKLRSQSAFKANLHDALKHIEVVLEDKNVKAVLVTVPDNMYYQFSEAIYSEDLAGYDIRQSEKEANQFFISRKIVEF